MSTLRLRNERDFHDRQAAQRAGALQPCDYAFDDASYLQHESWIAPAFELLGDLHGQRVLDLGCGHGMASVVLARRGADVVACDLSPGYVREARLRAEANNVRTRMVVCNGESLPFPDGYFTRIWGNAILHHLDLTRAAPEIARVLAPGGRGVFCEPWGGNRLLTWARRKLPYPGKARTTDEAPLGPKQLQQMQAVFPCLEVRGFQMLSMLGRVFNRPMLVSRLADCDAVLLRRCPAWQRYCRYVVVSVEK